MQKKAHDDLTSQGQEMGGVPHNMYSIEIDSSSLTISAAPEAHLTDKSTIYLERPLDDAH